MKNKGFLFLASLPLAMSLFACETETKKVLIPFGQEYDSSLALKEHLTKIDYGLYESFLEEKRSFALIVRGDNEDCRCWQIFNETISSYLKEHHARIYVIPREEMLESHSLRFQSGANTIAIYENGALAHQKLIKDSEDLASDPAALSAYLSERLYYLPIRYISRNQLESLYTADIAGFTIAFGRESCSDCRYLYSNFLAKIAPKLVGGIYLFDVDEIRADPEAYQDFKDEYGLSSLYSEFGYGNGVVPTFQYVTPGQAERKAELVKDACVYLNDALEKDGDTYKVSATYWDNSRSHPFLSESFSNVDLTKVSGIQSEEVYDFGTGAIYWKNEAASFYHDSILKTFLSYYVGIEE